MDLIIVVKYITQCMIKELENNYIQNKQENLDLRTKSINNASHVWLAGIFSICRPSSTRAIVKANYF